MAAISITRHSEFAKCKHHHVVINDDTYTLECETCGVSISPIKWLIGLANEERMLEFQTNNLRKEIADLKSSIQTKNRCKCEHCGKFTKIKKDSL
jgi:Zn finger protein HypA/HybF involved in hydrogenase expression